MTDASPDPLNMASGSPVAAARAVQRLFLACLDTVLDGAERPLALRADAAAILPWVSALPISGAALDRTARIMDARFLITDPPEPDAAMARAVETAFPPGFGSRALRAVRAGLSARSGMVLDPRRIAVLEMAATRDPVLRLAVARRVRDWLSDRVVFRPGPPPLALIQPQTVWLVIQTVALPTRARRARTLWHLLEQKALQDLDAGEWAGFWDLFLLWQTLRSDPALAETAVGSHLAVNPLSNPGEFAQVPPFVRPQWRDTAPAYALRYVEGGLF